MNAEQIFYIKSRGVGEEEAKKLLVDGFIAEIFEMIKERVPAFIAPVETGHAPSL